MSNYIPMTMSITYYIIMHMHTIHVRKRDGRYSNPKSFGIEWKSARIDNCGGKSVRLGLPEIRRTARYQTTLYVLS